MNVVSEPSPVNVFVEETKGLFNLLEITKAFNLLTSITGDKLALVVIIVSFSNRVWKTSNSFISLIRLATIRGSSK